MDEKFYQARQYHRGEGDDNWGIWHFIAKSDLDMWLDRIKRDPTTYELRELIVKPIPTLAMQTAKKDLESSDFYERIIRRQMNNLGQRQSQSLYSAFMQFTNEIRQNISKMNGSTWGNS